jgi:hypothetical protein
MGSVSGYFKKIKEENEDFYLGFTDKELARYQKLQNKINNWSNYWNFILLDRNWNTSDNYYTNILYWEKKTTSSCGLQKIFEKEKE